MKRQLLPFAFGLVLALTGYHRVAASPPAPAAPIAPAVQATLAALTEEGALVVETHRSVIDWRGTKFRGTADHEGTVRLASGTLQVQDGALTGGAFVIDMRSIEVTDIPRSDPKPRESLTNHLLSDHFFAVAAYPTAHFSITRVEPVEGDTYRVTGDLTMRGLTHPVTFDARIPVLTDDAVEATARFSIDRHRWGVSDRGCRLVSFVVDDEIHLELSLLAGRPGTSDA